MTYSISICYIEGYGDGYFEKSYRITAPSFTEAMDNALTDFLIEIDEELDDVIDDLEFSYCPV